MVGREFPSPYRYEGGRLRVIVDVSTIRGIVNAAFDQIRQAARNDAAVTIRLLETIATVAAQARGIEARAALRRQSVMVHRSSQAALPEDWDRNEATDRFHDVLALLGEVEI